MTWARPAGDTRYHSIAAVQGGSVITRCRGRWPLSHEAEEQAEPPQDERCGGCVRELEQLSDGERHGAQGEPATGVIGPKKQRPAVDFAFDMTDLEDVGVDE